MDGCELNRRRGGLRGFRIPGVLAVVGLAVMSLGAADVPQESAEEIGVMPNLTPTLTVTAEVDGQPVDALVAYGKKTYKTPCTFTLQTGQEYDVTVSYTPEASDLGYVPAVLSGEVDWKGPRMRRVALTRQPGPVAGQGWVADLGGGVSAALAWIPSGTTTLGSTREEHAWALGPQGQGAVRKGQYGAASTEAFEVARFINDGVPMPADIQEGFWLGQTEVTLEQWRQFIEDANYRTDAEKKGLAWAHDLNRDGTWRHMIERNWQNPGFTQTQAHPVVCVSWNDAKAFCDWLTEKERAAGRLPKGTVYRLPGEAEWAYACRGGREGTLFWWGDRLTDGNRRMNGAGSERAPNRKRYLQRYSWADGYFYTAPCGSFGLKGRNGYGLSDMIGNVWEWCEDSYDPTGAHAGIWTQDANLRVLRGGSFSSVPGFLRCAFRFKNVPSYASADVGFRFCLTSVQQW